MLRLSVTLQRANWSWPSCASGPDVAVGERVRIVGSDGATLLVEPVALLAKGEADSA